MIAWAPPAVHRFTGATDVQTLTRYNLIASDAAAVALDPDEKPLFDGEDGRAKTALYALRIGSFESGGFRADVDRQDAPTGDHGRAFCLMQLQFPYAAGITDRQSCFRHALSAIRDSHRACSALPFDQRLALYASGAADCSRGTRASEIRVRRITSWWKKHPFTPPDA